jgi:hypothetical protein
MFACKYDNCRLPGPQGPIGPIGPPGLDASGNLDMSCNNILDVSNIYFCNTDALLGIRRDFSAPGYPGFNPLDIANHPIISVSGDLDLSCNYILDVSRIYFCGGPVTTGRNWIGHGTSFDISCNETLRMTVPADASAVIQVGGTTELAIDASHVSISGGSVDTPALNFGLAGDYKTGMYHPALHEIEFGTNGSKRLLLWNKHVSIKGGTSAEPGINFGIESNDHNTGMYRVQADTIGFSANGTTEMIINDASYISISGGTENTPALNFGLAGHYADGIYYDGVGSTSGPGPAIVAGGTDRLHIGTSNVVVPVNNFICSGGAIRTTLASGAGDMHALGGGQIISGNPGSLVGGGLVRASATSGHDWEDGHMGNSLFLTFLGSEFSQMDVRTSGAIPDAWGVGDFQGTRSNYFGGAMSTPSGGGGSGTHITAMKLIPKGFNVAGEFSITANDETAWTLGSPTWVNPVGGGGGFASIAIFSQIINNIGAAAISLTGAALPINAGWSGVSGTWTGGLTATAFGDGVTAIIIQLTIPNGFQITIGDALISITISMQRG